jgi:NADPH2:quinone reductase
MGLNARYQFLLLYSVGPAHIAAAGDDISAAIAAGVLPVGEEAGLPVHRFPLAETAAAHQAVEAGATGKVLITVSES